MKILFASYEAYPFFKKGGLGDVAGSLPLALSKIGVNTTLILPGYKFLNLPYKTEVIGSFEVVFNHRKKEVTLSRMKYVTGVTLYIINHPMLNVIKSSKEGKTIEFIFFSKAIATMLSLKNEKRFGKFDLVHLHDWHTVLVAYFLKKLDKSSRIPTIFTIHNLYLRGKIEKKELDSLVGNEVDDPHFHDLLELGIKSADFVTTVSPTYAKEITKTRKGMDLRKLLFTRRNKVTGILNGIDYRKWNPWEDQNIKFKYTKSNFTKGKLNNKLSLQKELKLPVQGEKLLVSFIGRISPKQKGIDLILKTLGEILRKENFQMVILGKGNLVWTKKIGRVVAKHPKNLVFVNKFGEKLSHRIYAASDIILIPSKFEPCGLVQMIAMRYGTLPLVRKTGGLADTVVDKKNGFVFERYSATELTRTLKLALKLFREQPKIVEKMRKQAMSEDFSWDESAKEYKRLYSKLLHSFPRPC